MTRAKLLEQAEALRAMVRERDDAGYDVAIEAPSGFVWCSGDVHEMVGNCPDGRQNARNLVRKDLSERMRDGLKSCETKDCDWCGGAR